MEEDEEGELPAGREDARVPACGVLGWEAEAPEQGSGRGLN